MKRAIAGLVAVGFLMLGTVAWADTILKVITPVNIEGTTFRVTSKPLRKNAVEFAIRRDVTNVTRPSRCGYLKHPAVDGDKIGRPVKAEEDGKVWTFRFSVPVDQVEDSEFTLYGAGRPRAADEGMTYRFRMADFWNRTLGDEESDRRGGEERR